MSYSGVELRMDVRVDGYRAALVEHLNGRARDIEAMVTKALGSFDMGKAVEAAIHRELRESIDRSVKSALEGTVKEAVRVGVASALRERGA